MNYYEHHLGDYARDTAHLTILEHGAYRLLLDRYYATEQGIPEDQAHRVARARTKEEKISVDTVLKEFFSLREGIWINHRAEEEIEKAKSRISASQANGRRGGRPRKEPDGYKTETQEKPTGFSLGSETETQEKAHHTPYTIHQVNPEHVPDGTCLSLPAMPKDDPPCLPGEPKEPDKPDNLFAFPTAKGALPCPIERIVALYHEEMPDNPRCKGLNETRKGHIRARWREAAKLDTNPFLGGYTTVEQGLECWRRFFRICAMSDFLTGKAIPREGSPPFRATLAWLMKPENFLKTLENRYHREAA